MTLKELIDFEEWLFQRSAIEIPLSLMEEYIELQNKPTNE